MTQATVIAATTSAANSSDITVAAGSWVKVSMFMTGGQLANANERLLMVVQEKDPNGVYNNVRSGGKLLTLSRLKPQEVIVGPGTYRIVKSASTNSVGVYTES